jgi:hypothetical protein
VKEAYPLLVYGHSVDACIAANVLYIFGEGSEPDVAYVNNKVGYKAGEEFPSGGVTNLLLSEGFYVHRIGTFDEVRFINEGMNYLRERTPNWTQAHKEFWTPERLAERQSDTAQDIEFRQHFPYQYRHDVRPPAYMDILNFLTEEKVVDTSYAYHDNSPVVGAALFYGFDTDGKLKVYDPGDIEWLVTKPWVGDDFASSRWLPENGISAYWKP